MRCKLNNMVLRFFLSVALAAAFHPIPDPFSLIPLSIALRDTDQKPNYFRNTINFYSCHDISESLTRYMYARWS